MFVHRFGYLRFISQVQLPQPNLILDPRACFPHDARFHCKYHDDGVTVTLTTDDERCKQVCDIWMRVYNPAKETIPDFNSTIYRYYGRYHERAPGDTTIGIVDPSVKTIEMQAFKYCKEMKKCIIHDGVETIEDWAFDNCKSLEAVFLPPSIKKIEGSAFWGCRNIRILSIPSDIDVSHIGYAIIQDCDTFFRITQIKRYFLRSGLPINGDQVNQALLDFYRNMPPLHRACLHVNVSPQTIHDCIVTHGIQAASIIDHDGMTPLHILSLNPHATVGSIEECFDADESAALMGDNRGNTPLDYFLRENNLDAHTLLVASLCVHREAYSASTSNEDGEKP